MNAFVEQIRKHQKILFLFLVVFAGIITFYPALNFQGLIASGDHGRDLYAFKKTFEGGTPYKDYWWSYGPLMPYYYALCYKLLGVSIQSVFIGEVFFRILSGVFFYVILTLFFPAFFAALGSFWFMAFFMPFFHTYNHTAGIACILGTIYFLFAYLKNLRIRNVFYGLGVCFILSFIKINLGFSILAAFILSLLIIDFKTKRGLANAKIYLPALAMIPIATCLIYWIFFLKDLPIYAIQQCIPVLDNADQLPRAPLFQTILAFAKKEVTDIFSNWLAFPVVIAAFIFAFLFAFWRPQAREEKGLKAQITLGLGALTIFMLFALHEFLLSNVAYRFLWFKPLQTLFVFMVIGAGMMMQKKINRVFLSIIILVTACSALATEAVSVNAFKNLQHSFRFENTSIYVQNSARWISTVQETHRFLKQNLKENESFFALPYDPLFYFLMDRDSPTRQLIFFDYLNIPQAQEKEIIQDLENANVRYIVLSNRQDAKEPGLGTFGKTYCPLLASYINSHFAVVATIGDWVNEPGWAWSYGTKILKRIQK